MNNLEESRIQRADLLPTKTYYIIGFDKFLDEEEHEAVISYLGDPFILGSATNWVENVFYNNPKSIKYGNLEDIGKNLEI